MPVGETPLLRAQRRAIAIVASRYNEDVTDRLIEGAKGAFLAAGGRPDRLTTLDAPGSWELPIVVRAAALSRRFDAIVAIGCIVKGETTHDARLAEAVFSGLMRASLDSGLPVALGVLTVESQKQALARAGGAEGNKGAEAMNAALATLDSIDSLVRPAASASGRQRVGD